MIKKADKSDIQSYLTDAANISGNCDYVLFPENTAELCEILKETNNNKKKVTISAGRTGLTGGCVPNEGILVSLEKLNKIISIDTEAQNAIVEPGVFLSDFQTEVENNNLFYPPDPTETNATIGGTVATNASGARTFKYGATRNFVEELEIILPTGEITTLTRGKQKTNKYNGTINLESGKIIFDIPNYKMPKVKHAAGYYCEKNMDLIDLFIGAEGTLGIISKAKLKLLKKPNDIFSIIIFFENENDIFSFVQEIKSKSANNSSKIDLREIEFFDEHSLNLLRKEFSNIPENSKGAIWIEQEHTPDDEDEIIEEITKTILTNNGNEENIWFAMNEKERNELKYFRHSLPLAVNEIISGRNLQKVGTDTAVPDSKLIEFFNYTKKLIMENHLQYVVYGHIGNSHLHFNMLPKNQEEFILAKQLYGKICAKSVEFGGTISAEHGIGKLKRNYLLEMFGKENIQQMAKLKKVFDPNMILNIGNIFDKDFLEIT
jgi:D-lactate dehydrogenase (cytochrome)